jgi:hypothetical protein
VDNEASIKQKHQINSSCVIITGPAKSSLNGYRLITWGQSTQESLDHRFKDVLALLQKSVDTPELVLFQLPED